MGYQLKDICYPDQQSAVDAFFLSQQMHLQTTSEATSIFYFQKYQNDWSLCKQNTNTNTPSVCTVIENPVLSQCQYSSDPASNFMTGLELGGYVAAVIALAAIGKVIREKAI